MKHEIISRFGDKPKLKITRWAMGLGIAAFLFVPFLNFFAMVLRPLIDKSAGEEVGRAIGFNIGLFPIPLALTALVLGMISHHRGERSWAMWVGYLPGVVLTAFWVFMIVGEFVFPH